MTGIEGARRPLIAVEPDPSPKWARHAVESAGAQLAPAVAADAVIWTSLSGTGLAEVVASARRATWVQVASAGVEWLFDEGVFDASKTWTCGKSVYGPRVAELALGMLIGAFRNFADYARAREWAPLEGRSLAGADIAVLGGGGIGANLVTMLAPLGAATTAFTRTGTAVPGATRTLRVEALRPSAADFDAMVIAVPLTPATHHLVGWDLLDALPSHCWVVNVARGQIVDTAALVAALTNHSIGGAALDVTDPEPLPADHPLWELPNCFITPHVANYVHSDATPLADRIADNVARFVAGRELIGVIDPESRY